MTARGCCLNIHINMLQFLADDFRKAPRAKNNRLNKFAELSKLANFDPFFACFVRLSGRLLKSQGAALKHEY